MTDLIIIMVGSFHISTYISSVMHLNQGMGQWLIFVLLLKVKLLTVALSWKSLDLPKSVPRLELNAAVINSSILLFTKLTYQLKKTIFWSGSMLTLQYIQDICRKRNSKAITPYMINLPTFRMDYQRPPLTNIGFSDTVTFKIRRNPGIEFGTSRIDSG